MMPPADASRFPARYLLAGIQAGIAGAFGLLLFSMAGATLNRRSIWSLPNLMSTTFYGESAYRNGFHRATWAGLALHFALYAVLGAFWGLLVRDWTRPRIYAFGALYGIGWYYLLFQVFWAHVNPLIPLYSAAGNLRAGHLIWGMWLARSPRYAQYIREATAELPVSEAVEIRSGDVIL